MLYGNRLRRARGVVFINRGGLASELAVAVALSKRWHSPSLERFLYDFLEQIIAPDLARLERYEQALERMEREILSGEAEDRVHLRADLHRRGRLLRVVRPVKGDAKPVQQRVGAQLSVIPPRRVRGGAVKKFQVVTPQFFSYVSAAAPPAPADRGRCSRASPPPSGFPPCPRSPA